MEGKKDRAKERNEGEDRKEGKKEGTMPYKNEKGIKNRLIMMKEGQDRERGMGWIGWNQLVFLPMCVHDIPFVVWLEKEERG